MNFSLNKRETGMMLEMCCFSVSPGDWDAARKGWTSSVCHLWRKGIFFVFLNERLNMTIWISAHSQLLCLTLIRNMPPIYHSSPFPLTFALFQLSYLCYMPHCHFHQLCVLLPSSFFSSFLHCAPLICSLSEIQSWQR